jgi:hypothetical protein
MSGIDGGRCIEELGWVFRGLFSWIKAHGPGFS